MQEMKMIYYSYPKSPFLNPEDVVSELGLKPGEKILDFGAGSGFWALPMAEVVGNGGHVFVTDAKKENLAVIKNKATRQGLVNLSYFLAPYHGKEMPIQTKVDLILCSNVISLVGEARDFLAQAKKLAHNGTKLVIVEWNDKSPLGPRKENRIDIEEIILLAGKQGFKFGKLLSAGAQHTGLYFVYEN